jgi:hypothetical protein
MVLYIILKFEIGTAYQVLKKYEIKRDVFLKDMEERLNQFCTEKDKSGDIDITSEVNDCLVASVKATGRLKPNVTSGVFIRYIVGCKSIETIKHNYQIPSAETIDTYLKTPEFIQLMKQERYQSAIKRITDNFF